MKSSKKKTSWKYLLGGLAGVVLCGAVVGGVVSCSNGSNTPTTTSNSKTTNTQQAKPTTSTKNTTPTSSPKTKAPTQSSSTKKVSEPAYQLQATANTSTIAYKVNDTNSPTMIATKVPNYNTLISEPNNVIISVLGTPEAVINVAKDTSTKTAPDITLDLNQNSQLFKDIIKGVNSATNLAQLNNLITFTTTPGTKGTFNLNNYEGKYVSTQNISLSNWSFTYGLASANTIRALGVNIDGLGLFGLIPVDTFWSDLHPANNGTPSLIVTTTNNLFWKDKTKAETPFNVTINLLPLIKFSTQPTVLSLNSKDNISKHGEITNNPLPTPAWNLMVGHTKITQNEFIYVHQTWYTHVWQDVALSTTPIYVPYSANSGELSSVPYIYVEDHMYVVGTTTPSPNTVIIQEQMNTL